MSIKHWPEGQRPREKLLQQGAAALSDAELLAIFLRTGVPGLDAVGLSQSILNRFGSLTALFAADQQQFCAAPGLGPAKFVQLQAVLEMGRRFLQDELSQPQSLQSPAQSRQFLLAQMSRLQNEQFACIWLNAQHQLVKFETLFHGTIDSAAVYPREIVKAALRSNAAAVILAHNHPSGIAEPSHADRLITERIQAALKTVDVRVLDHMVVGRGVVISFAERGLI